MTFLFETASARAAKIKKPALVFCGVVFLLALCAGPASADDKPAANPAANPAGPDPAANPALAIVLKSGARAYYLGTREGLDGWFIVQNGQIQFVYAVPGGHNIIIGPLYGPNGEDITSAQTEAVLEAHPELKTEITNAAAMPPPGSAAAATDPTGAIAAAAMRADAMRKLAATTGAPQAGMGAVASPGERLMNDLKNAAGVDLGLASAPLLLMVMDPTCPHCQDTWRLLRDKVFSNALQIRLVPITRNPGDAEEERAAAQLLHVADPLNVWNKYVDGDKSQLAGAPDPALLQAVRANHHTIDSWHIQHSPYLVWRGKDGQVKILEGEPKDVAAVLSDLL